MKHMWKGALISLMLFVLVGSAMPALAAETLSVLTWEGYVTDKLIEDFKNETGITVEVTYISNNDELISKMRATGGEGYDVAQPSIDNTPEDRETSASISPWILPR